MSGCDAVEKANAMQTRRGLWRWGIFSVDEGAPPDGPLVLITGYLQFYVGPN